MTNPIVTTKDEYPLSLADLSVRALQEYSSPFSAWHELSSPITEQEVLNAVNNKTYALVETPLCFNQDPCIDVNQARQNHINKIAYFVVNEAIEPIHVEFGMFDEIYLNDGNHRLCAAIIKKLPSIKAELSGFIDCKFIIEFLYNPDV